MPVHRAFDVMAPMDVHSARCLAIQPGRAASSPPRAGRNFISIDLFGLISIFGTLPCRTAQEHHACRRGIYGEFVLSLFMPRGGNIILDVPVMLAPVTFFHGMAVEG